MSVLRHWHPVLTAAELRREPVGVRVDDTELVLFRSGSGVAALADRCPHRGGRLSDGEVHDGCVRCPYHGWSFAADGAGKNPATPAQNPKTVAYQAIERHQTIWVRDASAPGRFPDTGGHGWYQFYAKRHRIVAPLTLVLDNFTEVEHTGQVHAFFGYPSERMHEVRTRVETHADRVRVHNRGPQKPLPRWLRALVGVDRDDEFIDDWTTRFAPVHTRYDQWWAAPGSEVPRRSRLRVAVFFTPVDEDVTDLFTLAYVSEPGSARFGLNYLLTGLVKAFTELEVLVDVDILSGLADKRTDLRGHKLGRFDKVMGAHRDRIATIYRGEA